MRRRGMEIPPPTPWGQVIVLEAAAFTSLAWLSVLGGLDFARAEAGLDGGRVGWGLAELLRRIFTPVFLGGRIPQAILLSLLLGFLMIAGLGLLNPLLNWLRLEARRSQAVHAGRRADLLNSEPVVSEGPLAGSESSAVEAGQPKPKKRTFLPPEFRKSLGLPSTPAAPAANLPARDDRLPPLDLLVSEPYNRPDERNINLTAGLIEKTLAEFGIPAKVTGYQKGPTVTQFHIEPGFLEKDKTNGETDLNRQKVRVAQILALERDLTLALSAERLRIEAPVPGRPYVGVEVPNIRSSVVRLRPLLETEAFYKVGSPLAIALGRDVSGGPVVADLARMPHLLIAGTTGSGKSVCIAAVTAGLVMNNTPEELRLVMVDPKMVELVRFNGLPHLYGKVETDLERIQAVLRWTVAEMDRRYKVLEAMKARNLDSYNRKVRHRKSEETLPHIVLLIDELADLMMSMPEQTEHNLVRLAQMARATGIHLVVATQRPSTDVVTGLIKANFPARISFAVASGMDSRVILDYTGAESLLGKGDMLFLPPDASGPQRVQGVMVTDQEVEKVITFWQKAAPSPAQLAPTPWEQMLDEEQVLADRDDLVEKAVALIRETRRASASLLQRRLRIGYPRAARLMDELEELGVVGPSAGGGRDREVLIGDESDTPLVDEF
ncbi:MAG: DNA translocase FtsK, partial [Chloroflexi bacterium]|nr:DNA translocase FtsK [Chloroflexota bacterium]